MTPDVERPDVAMVRACLSRRFRDGKDWLPLAHEALDRLEAQLQRGEEGLREIERVAVDEGGEDAELFSNEAFFLRTARAALSVSEEAK